MIFVNGWSFINDWFTCANTHHDITIFEVDGMVGNIEIWISQEYSMTFAWNKKFWYYTSKIAFSQSIIFLTEVTLCWGSEFSSHKIALQTQNTQNDVTFWATKSNFYRNSSFELLTQICRY